MSAKVCMYVSIFHGYYHLVAGSTRKPTRGKPTKIQKENPIEVADSDKSSSLSSLNDTESDKMNRSDDEDGEANDDYDYDVAQMSNREVRRLFDDEVFFPCSSFYLGSETISPSCPRLQMMQLRCLTKIMTSKSLLPSLIAAGVGPARKLHDPRHQNPKGCSTMVKRGLMMTMTSLSMFSCLLEVLIGRKLAR
jgi:hypothetical protein